MEEQILNEITTEDLSFTVDGRLISELGEKLVTKNYLALAELIKNSYDADSKNVEISFHNVRKMGEVGTIIIKDTGTGMLWKEVRDNWMRVSTDNKEQKPVSDIFGRQKSGSKGIGRFSCQKLAESITMKTVAVTDDPDIVEVTTLVIQWNDFKLGKDLIETKCRSKYYLTEKSEATIGTTITLLNLKQTWNQLNYSALQRQLASLAISTPMRREGFKEDPGFEVFVDATEFESSDYKLSDKIMDATWGRVKGSIAEDGTVQLNFDGKLIGKRKHELHEKFPILKHASFDISCLPEMKEYQRNPQLMTVAQMRDIRESHNGVKVYSEGFRVYPYGQPGDDWLGLNRDVGRRKAKIDNDDLGEIASGYGLDRGRVMLDLFRNEHIVGSIQLNTNSNPAFEIKLNREGFVENEASKMLAKVLRYIVEWMTVQYAYFKVIHSTQENEKIEKDFVNQLKQVKTKDENTTQDLSLEDSKDQFEQALSLLLNEAQHKNVIADIADLSKDKGISEGKDISSELTVGSAKVKLIKTASKLLTTKYDASVKEAILLRAIASTGPLFFVFAHEFKSLVSSLDVDAGEIEQWIVKNNPKDTQWLSDIAVSLRLSRQRFSSLENLIGVFASTHKTDVKRIKVIDAIEKVCRGFEFVTSGSQITIDYGDIAPLLKTKEISDAAFYSILVNLVSNAIKAVMAKGIRHIRITAIREPNLVIRVEDKGFGLPKEQWEDVFISLVRDPTGQMYEELYGKAGVDELAVLGRGTGLGLNIVKGMVQDNGGTVKFVEPSSGWKTCIEVILP